MNTEKDAGLGGADDADAHVIDRLRYFMHHAEQCPQFSAHTPGPAGYREWFEWVATQQKTHKQRQCPGCGLYAIWTKRTADDPLEPDDFIEYESAV
jgi:hypothetical protein